MGVTTALKMRWGKECGPEPLVLLRMTVRIYAQLFVCFFLAIVILCNCVKCFWFETACLTRTLKKKGGKASVPCGDSSSSDSDSSDSHSSSKNESIGFTSCGSGVNVEETQTYNVDAALVEAAAKVHHEFMSGYVLLTFASAA